MGRTRRCCVSAHDPRYASVEDIDDVSAYDRVDMAHFFALGPSGSGDPATVGLRGGDAR